MGEYSDQEREGKMKGDNGILACSREVNTKFSRTKMKGIAMKRMTIAWFWKDDKILKILRGHRGRDMTT